MSSLANSTWVLTDERKKTLQEAIKNFNSTSFLAGRPDFGAGINKPAVIFVDDIKRMENDKVNLLKEQQNIYTNGQEAFIKNTQQQPEPFLKKHKNHLLLLLAVVAGYFAYKKFKK